MIRCPNCGHDNQDDMRFCTACGAALDASAPGGQVRADRSQQASALNTPSIFFMNYVINKLSDGTVFRVFFAILLKILAIVGVILGIWFWLLSFRVLTQLEDAGLVVVVILHLLLFPVFLYMAVHTVIIRARHIANLGASEFTLIPITCLLIRLQGELSAMWCVWGCLRSGIAWIYNGIAWIFQPDELQKAILYPMPPFWSLVEAVLTNYGPFAKGGVVTLLWLLVAVVSLVSSYLASELLGLIPAIVRNTEAIRRVIEQNASTGQPTP